MAEMQFYRSSDSFLKIVKKKTYDYFFKIFSLKEAANMEICTQKKIEVLSLKIFAMRRFKNESWYFYAKSEFLSKARNIFNI